MSDLHHPLRLAGTSLLLTALLAGPPGPVASGQSAGGQRLAAVVHAARPTRPPAGAGCTQRLCGYRIEPIPLAPPHGAQMIAIPPALPGKGEVILLNTPPHRP